MSATWDSKGVKATPLPLDEVLIIDTADSRNQKRVTLASFGGDIWTKSGTNIFQNILTDKVGIGLNNPTSLLQLAAGTSTLAPLKLSDGLFLTTLQDGTIEYKSNLEKLTFTSGLYREQINKRLETTVAVKSVETWTARTAAQPNDWNSVIWSPELGLFAAVSSTGTNNRIMTSKDGINWTIQTTPVDNSWESIAWSPEELIFVAVSSDGNLDQVMTSKDGITWTGRVTPQNNSWQSVVWSPEQLTFVAVSSDGANRVMISTNGANWVVRTAAQANAWNFVTWSPELGLFVAVSSTGTNNRVMTSTDGDTWTTQTTADENSWNSITWSPELNLFAAVASDGTNRVITSPDGITWTGILVPDSNLWDSIAWSPELGIFAAVSPDGVSQVMTSKDGITWDARGAVGNDQWSSIAWSPELGIFAAVAITGTDRVMTSLPPTSFSNISTLLAGKASIGTTDQDLNTTLNVVGDTHLEFTAIAADTHAIEIITNAAGFGDVKSLAIDYTTGNLPMLDDNAVILINIDESSSTNGQIHALEILTTTVQPNTIKVSVKTGIGIDPIHQDSGVFGNAASILVNATTQLTALSSGGAGNIPVFVNNTDTITIGKLTKFEEIEIIIKTPASGGGVHPLFEFSTGIGIWTAFSPTDGTNGFRNTGVIAFEVSLITGWMTGLNSEFLIRITRTRTNIPISPILDLIQIAASTIFFWNKDGNIVVNGGTFNDPLNMSSNLINSVLDPVSAQDAATKNYVDTGTAIWTKSGTNIFQTTLTDNVGIGLNGPTELLQMFGGNFNLKPHNPVRLFTITNGTNLNKPSDVHIVDNHAFVASEDGNSLTVIDISMPTAPVILATLIDNTNLVGARGVFVAGRFAYVTCKGGTATGATGTVTVSAGAVTAVTVVAGGASYTNGETVNLTSSGSGTGATGTVTVSAGAVTAVTVVLGGKNYTNSETVTLTSGVESLTSIDISTPSSPTFKTKVTIANAGKVYVSGIHAFVTDPVLHKLHIFDIHETENLTLDGTFTDAVNMNTPSSVYTSGRYAYVTGEGSDSLVIIDVDDDENPTLTGKLLDSTNMNGAKAVYVVGNHAYVVSNVGDSLAVIDVGTPATPVLAGSLLNPTFETNSVLNGASSIFVGENHAYIASADVSAVTIVNVSIHTSPVIVGAVVDVANLGDVSSLFMSGKHLCSVSPTNNSFSSVDVHGVDVPTADIGSLEVGTLSVRDNVIIADDLYSSTLSVGHGALIGEQLSVSGKLKVFGDLNAGNNTLHVDVTDKVVQIGGDTLATDLTVFQQTTPSKKGFTLSGQGITGSNLTTDGMVWLLGNSQVGNMQAWIGQKSDVDDDSKVFFRLFGGVAVPSLGAVSGKGISNRHFILGNPGSKVGVGFDGGSAVQSDIVGQLHVKAGTIGDIASIIQAFGTQTVDLFQVRNSAGAVQFAIDKDFKLTNAVLTTPTIGDFTNATHDHSNLAGGGNLTNSALTSGVFSSITGIGTQSQALNMNTANKIINVAEPTLSQDAATKNYVDTHSANAIWTKSTANIFPTTLTDKVGIGRSDPTAFLHIAAGTATLAPLKLSDGLFLTTLQDGTLEYKSNIEKLTFTSGNYREQLNKRIAPTVAVQSVSTWTARTEIQTNDWREVVWSPELSLFAAVATTGTDQVMTSPDGINWTVRTEATTNSWISIAWSPELGLFAAVAGTGTLNRIMTSVDGITWVGQTTPATADIDWKFITWSPELGLFAAVAGTGTGNSRVMTSSNGTVWTTQTSAADNIWQSVAWSPELTLFVAVSPDGTANRVMTSPNGTAWTIGTSIPENDWRDVTWSPELGLFVAVSSGGTSTVMTSPDGINWTSRTIPEANQWQSVDWSPELGLFVAVSFNGTNRIMSSPDGLTWTVRSASDPNGWQSLAWAPELGIFTAVASAGTNRVMTSEPSASSQFSTITTGEIFDDDGRLNATSENVIPVYKESDFGVPSGGAITLAANTLYRRMAPIVMANTLVFQSNTRIDSLIGAVNTLTYSGTGTFISGFAAAGARIENTTLISTGAGATLFNLSGIGTMNLANFDANNFENLGTISDFILLNAENYRFSGWKTGLTVNNVANITGLVYAFISSATPNATSALRITGRNTTSVFLLIATMVNTAPANNFFISPTINDNATVRINNTATIGTGDFFEAGTTGSIAAFAINNPAPFIASVTNSSGIAEFDTVAAHGLVLEDIVVNTGFDIEASYNGTFIVSKIVDTLRYQVSLNGVPLAFTNPDAGNVQIRRTQATTSVAHGLANGTPIQITLSTDYTGNFNITNASGSVFDIQAEFVATGTGNFNSGSIDKTEPRMQVSASSPEEDSTVAGGWHASGSTSLTTLSASYTDFVLPATRLRFSYNERILYLSQVNGEIEYTGLEPKSINIHLTVDLDPTSGSDSSVIIKLLIDRGSGYVDLPDLVEDEFSFKALANTINIARKVTMKTGDKVKWQIKQGTVGSTNVTVGHGDIMI